jgi:hypothetical protein
MAGIDFHLSIIFPRGGVENAICLIGKLNSDQGEELSCSETEVIRGDDIVFPCINPVVSHRHHRGAGCIVLMVLVVANGTAMGVGESGAAHLVLLAKVLVKSAFDLVYAVIEMIECGVDRIQRDANECHDGENRDDL